MKAGTYALLGKIVENYQRLLNDNNADKTDNT